MANNKITPAFWYHTKDGKAQEVIDYYSEIFENNFKAESPISLGKTPSGYTELCNVKIFDNPYFLMTTALEHQKFNDSFSLMVHCEDQIEIDKFWNYFTKDGKESMCGWCIDKYGLRWQIIPKNIGELMSKPNAGQVMSKQTKIIIEEY